MAHKFEIYKDKAGEFRVRFKYNSEVIFSTEGYTSKASAQKAIKSIKEKGPTAPIEDSSEAKPAAPKAAKAEPAAKAPAKKAAPAKAAAKPAKVAAKPAAKAKAAPKATASA